MDFYEINPEYGSHLMLLNDQGRGLTYGECKKILTETGENLQTGTLLFLFCENSIGSIVFYLTCLNRKVVPLLLDKNMDKTLAGQLIKTYEPEYMAMPAGMEIIGDGYRKKVDAGIMGYVVYEREQKGHVRLHEDLALLLSTSGSTGSPKFVRQSRKNIESNARSIAEYLKLDASERPILLLPMNYTFGLSIINSHLAVGATILVTGRTLFEKEFWDFFREAKATSMSGVPYTFEMLKRLSFFDMDVPSLRTMTQAGGKLAVGLHREFAGYAAGTGRKFVVMYGQTEATARMGYLPKEYAMEKCGSMGIAIPGGRFRLMDGEGKEITGPDTVGELVYEGDNVTMGYAKCREDLSKGDEFGGVLYTGDMAKRDADGFYYITGRKKRFLKLYGKRVNMDEIEQLLKEKYDGIDVSCTGEDDHMRIYLAGQSGEFCEEVRKWLTATTGLHPSGVKVVSIAKIPKNSFGKTIYKELP